MKSFKIKVLLPFGSEVYFNTSALNVNEAVKNMSIIYPDNFGYIIK